MMRVIFFISIVALFMAACGGRRSPAAENATVSRSQSVIELNASRVLTGRDTIELGRLRAGEVVEYQLGVKNTDSSPLVILNVGTTCGCTTLDYDSAPIVTGDTAFVTLQYDSNGQSGSQLKLIRLTTSFDARPYNILLHADVQP